MTQKELDSRKRLEKGKEERKEKATWAPSW
jgi:hypothetical protein